MKNLMIAVIAVLSLSSTGLANEVKYPSQFEINPQTQVEGNKTEDGSELNITPETTIEDGF